MNCQSENFKYMIIEGRQLFAIGRKQVLESEGYNQIGTPFTFLKEVEPKGTQQIYYMILMAKRL